MEWKHSPIINYRTGKKSNRKIMKQVKYWIPNYNGDIISGECESMRYGNKANIN